MKLRLRTKILIACVIYYLIYSLPLCAQTEQECSGAINIVSPINTFPAYSGEGILNEINTQVSSCLFSEANSVWFTFMMCDTGYCLFKIIPTDSTADYDWALFNFTNKTCENVFDTLSENELRCNFSAIPGVTGLDTPYVLTSASAGGPNKCAPLSTFSGQKLLLLVNNPDQDSLGFALSFGGSSLPCIYPTCNAEFIIIPDTTQTGLYYGYNLSTGNNLIYTWNWGDGTTSTGQLPSHIYSDSGFYQICLMINDTITACQDTFCADYQILKPSDLLNIHEVIFVNYPVGIPSIEIVGWSLFPNPAEDFFTVNSGNFQIAELRMLDIYGRILKSIQRYDGEKISLKQFLSHNYIVQVLIKDKWYSKLLIKL